MPKGNVSPKLIWITDLSDDHLMLSCLGQEKYFKRKIVIIVLLISLNMCLGAERNRLNETILLSSHNICFG